MRILRLLFIFLCLVVVLSFIWWMDQTIRYHQCKRTIELTRYPHYLSVGAMFKNEGHILKEWIDHYRTRGVDHFYLINDNSTDNYMSILQPFVDADLMTLFSAADDASDGLKGRQTRCYQQFFTPILTSTRWLAILDLDEFLYSPSTLNLSDVFRKHDQTVSQIEVNWVWFGSNGHVKQPESVINGFTMRAPYDLQKMSPCPDNIHRLNGSHGPKCIFQTAMLKSFGIHNHDVHGPTVNRSYRDDPVNPLLLINHYAVQSVEFWQTIKATRGDVNRHFSRDARNLDYFNCWDINDIPDHRLRLQNK